MVFMTHRLPLVLLLVLAACLPACTNAYQLNDAILMQARQASDMADLRFASLSAGTWAAVHLDIQSTAEDAGIFMDETGFHPSGQPAHLVKSGTCTVLQPVHGELPQRQWNFTLNDPLGGGGLLGTHSLRADVPLIRTGTYLAQLDPAKNDRARFPQLLAMPADWQPFPAAALQSYSDFVAGIGPNDGQVGMLKRFFDDPNPLIQLEAWHNLVLVAAPQDVCDRLTQTRGTRQAALLLLVAAHMPAESHAQVLQLLQPVLANTRDPDAMLGLAISAWTALGLDPEASNFTQAVLHLIPIELGNGFSPAARQIARLRQLGYN